MPVEPRNRGERLKWAGPGLGLAALALASADALFEPDPERLSRLQELERTPRRARFRFALPGTADAEGRLTGRPGPLGTGFLWLSIHRGAPSELLRARFRAPRSASLAEREWNLLCHLRAHGVGTPEPLLVGARGGGLWSAHSFVLVRAPEDAFPLPRWLRTDGIGPMRARGLEALGRTLALLGRSGVVLPELVPEHLWLTGAPGSGECAEHVPTGPQRNRLPSVLVVEVRGARFAGTTRATLGPAFQELLTPAEFAALTAAATG